jgi:hypothetical protein
VQSPENGVPSPEPGIHARPDGPRR